MAPVRIVPGVASRKLADLKEADSDWNSTSPSFR